MVCSIPDNQFTYPQLALSICTTDKQGDDSGHTDEKKAPMLWGTGSANLRNERTVKRPLPILRSSKKLEPSLPSILFRLGLPSSTNESYRTPPHIAIGNFSSKHARRICYIFSISTHSGNVFEGLCLEMTTVSGAAHAARRCLRFSMADFTRRS